MGAEAKFCKAEVAKVDSDLGLVFGWAIVCTEKGEDHYDLQGDHIPESVMVEATTDFMEHARIAKEMHQGDQIGMVLHSFPMTADIAKAMGIATERTGWMVAMKPGTDVLQKFKDRVYTGFSIGGDCAYLAEAI